MEILDLTVKMEYLVKKVKMVCKVSIVLDASIKEVKGEIGAHLDYQDFLVEKEDEE